MTHDTIEQRFDQKEIKKKDWTHVSDDLKIDGWLTLTQLVLTYFLNFIYVKQRTRCRRT